MSCGYAVDACTLVDGAERRETAGTVGTDLGAIRLAEKLLTTPDATIVKVNVWVVDEHGTERGFVDGYTADDFPEDEPA